jgi:ABC-2 type transport system permease protein
MKVFDIAFKDILRSTRSLFLIGMALLAPLLVTALIYFAFGGVGSDESSDLPAVTVAIVNLDQTPVASPLAIGDALYNMFTDPSIESWLTAVELTDEADARAALDRQEVGAVVIVPQDFSASILSGETGQPILILQDPTLTIGPMVVHNMVTSFLDGITGGGVAIQVVLERQAANGLATDTSGINNLISRYQEWYTNFQRALFHDPKQAALLVTTPTVEEQASQDTGTQILSLVMAGQMIFFAFYTGSYSMMSILTEQEEGTLARLFTTPTDRTFILTGKFLAVFLTVLLQGIVLLIAGRLAFQLSWGQPPSVLLALLGQVIGSTGLGVLLISLVKTTKQAGPILGGGLSAMGMLSGLFTVAIPNMPAIFDFIALFTPQGWVLKGWDLAIAGSPAVELLLPLAVTTAMGLVMFAIGAALFRRRFA